jgi:hypothetical protein
LICTKMQPDNSREERAGAPTTGDLHDCAATSGASFLSALLVAGAAFSV